MDNIVETNEIKPAYTWISLESIDDFDKLSGCVDSEYAPGAVAEMLKGGLSPAVKAVLVEANYADKDYRSSYYNFYSKKGLYYRSDCVRLHFFDLTVRFDQESLQLSYERAYTGDVNFTDHYFGYMVLRPTGVSTIGRSVINADVVLGAEGRVIDAWHKVHLLGYKLKVCGFPWMQQHMDISRCAHAACWAILRHFSERFSAYGEHLLYDITNMAHPFNPGGLAPSLGLDVMQANRVFHQAGVFPLLVAHDDQYAIDTSFFRQMVAYIESGFPLFVSLPGHAVVIVGYRWRDGVAPKSNEPRFAWEQIEHLLVVDDNHMPYLSIPARGPSESTQTMGAEEIQVLDGEPNQSNVAEEQGFQDENLDYPYSAEEHVDSFIVPLPEKLFYPAQAVEEQITALFGFDSFLDLPAKGDAIVRYFVTTGAAYRKFVRENQSAYDSQLFENIMNMPFSQFIWVVEIATEEDWLGQRVTARAVLDASASVTEEVPLWLFHTVEKGLVFNRDQVGLLPVDSVKVLEFPRKAGFVLTRMEVNLRAVR